MPSRFFHSEDINNIITACAILHNMVTEARNADGHMGTQYIVSIYSEAQAVSFKTLHVPDGPYDAAHFYREQADAIKYIRDHERLTGAVADMICAKCGKGKLVPRNTC